MYGTTLFYLLALATLCLTIDQRKSNTIISNHLRVTNPDPDDAELMEFQASGTKAGKKTNKPDRDEKVKTLSQQIADGKYGLIQKELFLKPPKRPGIVSYENNPEVPNDNIGNLGGLDKDEIWLAENHLLVLRGGKYPPHDDRKDVTNESPWPPIDNYKAPLHQVKIPKHPKVPPPFPVQLSENGPLQILGTNFSRTLNETDEQTAYALPPPEFFDPSAIYNPGDTNSTNSSAWAAQMPVPVDPSGEYPGGMPFPPHLLNATLPPFLGYLPPGAVVLPPPGNQTDFYDYDDPSIYYPPPYSFFYPKDNSSAVPAGPLVPGIVLPPPPNFFAPMDDTTTRPTTIRKPQRQRKPITNTPRSRTTTPVPTTTNTETTSRRTIKIYPVSEEPYLNEIKPTVTTTTPKTVTILSSHPDRSYLPVPRMPVSTPSFKKKTGVTILRPVKPPTSPKVYVYNNEIPAKPLREYKPSKISVTTTQVPLKYHTTSNDIETNSGTQQTEKYRSTRKNKSAMTTLRPAEYYYYEEATNKPVETTPRTPIRQSSYVDNNEETYVKPKVVSAVRQRRPQYIYVTGRPYNTQKPRFRFIQQPAKPDSFSIHIANIQKQIQQFTTTKPNYRTSSKPVYQFSFQAANYKSAKNNDFKPSPVELQGDQFRPLPPKYSVEVQQAIEILPSERPKFVEHSRPVYYQQSYQQPRKPPRQYYTTPEPQYQYDTVTQKAQYIQNVATPRPITQFSFEVTPNPIFQGFYTKPDEGYFDDRTRTYFTMFGKKLPAPTTPLPGIEQTTRQIQYEERPSYQQRPISLEGDTLVNYLNPRPTINPDAELVPVNNQPTYPNVVRYTSRPSADVPKNENPEIIRAIPIEVESTKSEDGSFISYQLPGDDGAHFYFLTPQLARSRDQGSGFYYSQPQRSRIRRNEKINDKER
ncbi:unnamed protein product [Phaedon cochleariae]|uniref:Uncharacterized protein n=1 Tax=Phaedon cochleariae TaxID=80249 RepID=A0A9P0GQH9_PHACE|nr:unnamed protein product [Phaedon cochleariae]